MKKNINIKIKLIITTILSMSIILTVLALNTYAADNPFPGKPSDMSVSGSNIVKVFDGSDLWLCPSSGGQIEYKAIGDDYEITPVAYGGYTFSHWATYYVRRNLTDHFEHANPHSENGFLFSKIDNSSQPYNQFDEKIRLNNNSNYRGTYYIYAVFKPGVSVTVNVDFPESIPDNEGPYSKITINKVGNVYEDLMQPSYGRNFRVVIPQGSNIGVSLVLNSVPFTVFDKVYINNQDKTSIYKGDNNVIMYLGGPHSKEEIYSNGVTSDINITITSKARKALVKFDGNGATSGNMNPQEFSFYESQNISSNQFKKDGHVFVGWKYTYTLSNVESTEYYLDDADEITFVSRLNNDSLNNKLVSNQGDNVFYAQWKKEQTNITPPTAKDNLMYNGNSLQLINLGYAEHGKMLYSLEEDGNYSETIPTGNVAKTYKVYYYVQGEGDYLDSPVSYIESTINKGVPTADQFLFVPPENTTYDGTEKMVNLTSSITNMGEITVKYYDENGNLLNTKPSESGTYTVKIDVAENSNYKSVSDLTSDTWKFTINPSELIYTEPVANILTYNGSLQKLVKDGSTPYGTTIYYSLDNVNWSIESPTAKDADCYTVYYKIDGGRNYNSISTKSIEVVINPKSLVESDLIIGENPIYDGNEKNIEYTVTDGITYKVSGNSGINVGDYTLEVKGVGNYTGTITKKWKILPVDAVLYSNPTANSLIYNKKEQPLITAGSTYDGIIMYSLEEKGTYSTNIPCATQAGHYEVWYYIEGDDNHNDSQYSRVFVTIQKADPNIGDVYADVIENTTDISLINLHRTDNSVEGNLSIEDGQSLQLGENNIKYIFTPIDIRNYNSIEGNVNVNVIDTISPLAKMTMDSYQWDTFLHNIYFDIYSKKELSILVTAYDDFSGVSKVEYYITQDTLDLNDVIILNEDYWQVMNNNNIVIPIEDGKQFVVYVKVTDYSGNITYLSTNGIEYDITAPEINGVSNNCVYYTSQYVDIFEKNLDSVFLNDEEIDPKTNITLNPSIEETEYKICVLDKAGNTNTVFIVLKNLDEITDIHSDNLQLDNKTEILNLIDYLEKELSEKEDILLDDEKISIEEKIYELEGLLKAICNVENVSDLVNNLPQNISKKDLEKVKKAENAYNELSDYEKRLINSEIKDILEDAKNIIKMLNENDKINTGDDTNIGIYLVLALFTLGAGVILSRRNKK